MGGGGGWGFLETKGRAAGFTLAVVTKVGPVTGGVVAAVLPIAPLV